MIPNVHESVFPALGQSVVLQPDEAGALGVVETFSGVSILAAADRAAKAARVTLFRIHVAMALGGKGLLLMTGSVSDVRAGVDAAADEARAARPAGFRNRPAAAEQGTVLRIICNCLVRSWATPVGNALRGVPYGRRISPLQGTPRRAFPTPSWNFTPPRSVELLAFSVFVNNQTGGKYHESSAFFPDRSSSSFELVCNRRHRPSPSDRLPIGTWPNWDSFSMA